MRTLLENFSLTKLSPFFYEASSRKNAWPRVFGGLFLAQSIRAAYQALDEACIFDQTIHSLHSYFLYPGCTDRSFYYEIKFLRKGKSFTSLNVIVRQKDDLEEKILFTALLSFQKEEDGFSYCEEDSRIKNYDFPKDLDKTDFSKYEPELMQNYWKLQLPFVFYPMNQDNYIHRTKKIVENDNYFFLKKENLNEPLRKRDVASLLAYMSDMSILDNALILQNESIFTQNMQTGSLDHSLWFHTALSDKNFKEIFKTSLLYRVKTSSIGGNRAFISGKIYNLEGKLLVSCAQEGLARRKIKS